MLKGTILMRQGFREAKTCGKLKRTANSYKLPQYETFFELQIGKYKHFMLNICLFLWGEWKLGQIGPWALFFCTKNMYMTQRCGLYWTLQWQTTSKFWQTPYWLKLNSRIGFVLVVGRFDCQSFPPNFGVSWFGLFWSVVSATSCFGRGSFQPRGGGGVLSSFLHMLAWTQHLLCTQ